MNINSHNYNHTHEHKENNEVKRDSHNIKITFYLNIIFATLELIVGLFSNSIALVSNSIHDYGDSVILFFTLKVEKFSLNGRDAKYTYGYRRFTLVGAIINWIILIIGSIIIIVSAINRITNPQVVKEGILIIFAILGIIVNLIGTYKVSRKKSIVSDAVAKNLLLDSINWFIILIGAILMEITNIYYIDSILSLIIAVVMLSSIVKDFKKVFEKLMQAVPNDIDVNEVQKFIENYEGVLNCHDLHIWDLDGEDYISSFHIVINDEIDPTKAMYIKESLKNALEKYKINHTTIEIDRKTQAIYNKEIDK